MQRHSNAAQAAAFKGCLQRYKSAFLLASALALVGLIGYAPAASAQVPPTFTIIGPNEWKLPIPKPGHGVTGFFQTSIYTVGNKHFDLDGDLHHANPTDHVFLGISRLAHIFSFKALPNVGFFWEYLQPEVYLEQGNDTTSGLGDPKVLLAAFVKPVKNMTVGLENLVSIPVGENELSNHYWEDRPYIMFDYQIGHVGIDNTVGFGVKTDKHHNGKKSEQGMDFFESLRLSLRGTNPYVEPFFAYDYARTRSGSWRS
jgi:hypothetical protein